MYDSVVFEDLFLIRVVPDQYKTQQMCDKAVNDCLAGMKLVPDLFATSQMILFTTLYTGENILFLMKIMVMWYFLAMKWVFLIKLLKMLILMILVMGKMILILLFLSDFWLYILNSKNLKHLKKS